MAAKKFYSYYLRGNQIAIIEEDIDDNGRWKSPVATVADGLEVEYTYNPTYSIINTNVTHTTITDYKSTTTGGYLKVKGGSVNYDTTLDVGDYIVFRNAGQFNGLHKITSIDDAAATKDSITFSTKYSGSSSWSAFEETVTLYYSINVLNDESDVVDLPSFLSKALVYYVKARWAEDRMDIEAKEYFLREFRSMLGQHESARIWGPRMIQSGLNAIK